jgi:hypothetical protein
MLRAGQFSGMPRGNWTEWSRTWSGRAVHILNKFSPTEVGDVVSEVLVDQSGGGEPLRIPVSGRAIQTYSIQTP